MASRGSASNFTRRELPERLAVGDTQQEALAWSWRVAVRLRYDDVALVLERLSLPADLAATLRSATVDVHLADDQVAALNDACLAHLQEHGFDERGGPTPAGRRLEQIIDALNED